MESTPFQDGHFFLTTDTGELYIDATVGQDKKRFPVSQKAKYVTATLATASWSSNSQTVKISGLGATQNGIIGLPQSATATQREAAAKAELYVSGQSAGAITVSYSGTKPGCDIPVAIVLWS